MEYSMYWLALMVYNAIGFLMVGMDKWKAKRGRWRIPEKHFFIFSFFGGAVGVYLGMQVFRHKTQHKKFIYGIPLMIVLNAVLLYFLIGGIV